MNFPKPGTLILDQIERPPGSLIHEAIGRARDSVTSALIEGLAEQRAEVESVCATSEIQEERTFSREDILRLIVLFATVNQLKLQTLKVTKIINDPKGTLLVLEVKSPTANGGYRLINYTIKGRHDGNESGTTSLDQTFWDQNDDPEGGGTIAEYLDGKWRFKESQ